MLQAVGEGEGVVHFIMLEDVQAAVQENLPAVVGHNVAGMNGSGCVEFPGKVDANRTAGFLDLQEVLFLLIAFEFVFCRYQVDGDFFLLGLVFYDRFKELHQVANLVEQPDVGVCNGDPACAAQVGAKQGVKRDAPLVLLENKVSFRQWFRSREAGLFLDHRFTRLNAGILFPKIGVSVFRLRFPAPRPLNPVSAYCGNSADILLPPAL